MIIVIIIITINIIIKHTIDARKRNINAHHLFINAHKHIIHACKKMH